MMPAERHDTCTQEKRRKGFVIQTRFGSSRQLKSRKDRPCDACRKRKTACVISSRPPCRFCHSRGIDCSFVTVPKKRDRSGSTGQKISASGIRNAPATSARPQRELPSCAHSSRDEVPISSAPLYSQHSHTPTGIEALSPISMVSPSENRHAIVDERTPAPLDAIPLSVPQTINPQLEHPNQSHCPGSEIRFAEDDPPEGTDGNSASSLEDRKDFTAHFIGLAGEQDSNVLASFRSDILNEFDYVDVNVRQVSPGDATLGLPPVHFSVVHNYFPERDRRAKCKAADGIDAIVGKHHEALMRLYFQFVHPAFPILSKERFIRQYLHDKSSISPALRGAVYGLACQFQDQEDSLRVGTPINQAAIFEHVHASLNRELDSPKLSTLQACLLVLHEQPAENGTTESPKQWTYAAQAVACAQCLGLHRDPSSWNIPSWEKRLRKKLWWATFFTDKWFSICHGNPPFIQPCSFDTADVEIADLSAGEELSTLSCPQLIRERDSSATVSLAVRFIETMKLTKMLDGVLGFSFTPSGYQNMVHEFASNEPSLIYYQNALSDWHTLLPQCLTFSNHTGDASNNANGSLYLAFFALQALVFRALMAPANVASHPDAASNLRRHFDTAVSCFWPFVHFIGEIELDTLRTFWGRHSRTNLVICGNFLIYLFLCAYTPDRVKVAYELLQSFHNSLKRLNTMASENDVGLLRPAILRVDSFFDQAVGIMRARSQNQASSVPQDERTAWPG